MLQIDAVGSTYHPQCSWQGCNAFPVYGFVGSHLLCCALHKMDGMLKVNGRRRKRMTYTTSNAGSGRKTIKLSGPRRTDPGDARSPVKEVTGDRGKLGKQLFRNTRGALGAAPAAGSCLEEICAPNVSCGHPGGSNGQPMKSCDSVFSSSESTVKTAHSGKSSTSHEGRGGAQEVALPSCFDPADDPVPSLALTAQGVWKGGAGASAATPEKELQMRRCNGQVDSNESNEVGQVSESKKEDDSVPAWTLVAKRHHGTAGGSAARELKTAFGVVDISEAPELSSSCVASTQQPSPFGQSLEGGEGTDRLILPPKVIWAEELGDEGRKGTTGMETSGGRVPLALRLLSPGTGSATSPPHVKLVCPPAAAPRPEVGGDPGRVLGSAPLLNAVAPPECGGLEPEVLHKAIRTSEVLFLQSRNVHRQL
ncbi:unnamed protein product [Discosporangium mesarthrocarpum]